ncbi:hypothetical protein PoB_000100200 [Plakobranchus ocellatus]|uniref:Uncharacterized protein n=1 Tax=Plakobranchus ocellatus TaxID=259542 RepID=A0AAV3XXC1_9GAST|nr:hypothetical protein PoB_000100200 [Plakobranchus ocellatus]
MTARALKASMLLNMLLARRVAFDVNPQAIKEQQAHLLLASCSRQMLLVWTLKCWSSAQLIGSCKAQRSYSFLCEQARRISAL